MIAQAAFKAFVLVLEAIVVTTLVSLALESPSTSVLPAPLLQLYTSLAPKTIVVTQPVASVQDQKLTNAQPVPPPPLHIPCH